MQVFTNVDLNLKTAGVKGWSQVFRVTSYHVSMTDEALEICVQDFKKYMTGY
ncbi:l-psp endoribonuclease family protein [Colletotrichum truncatum]|uniref:L-psp endoribonuclease family protein n=1 Tax=Colletotrichum truncatum TaxID=5467 RepID=A0ACC3YRB2_COLTU|nr:l-psp endoribonuclease family protein [Colletotrichum truncatum]KAF6799182.1 l-psp endoribonuclease family protein [Colletotrichum truncatum]